ncbi:helix-turn-helix domain-containing protein, partial [Escherichia coli]
RCVCGKKIGPDPRNFNQRVSLGRNDLLIRTFLRGVVYAGLSRDIRKELVYVINGRFLRKDIKKDKITDREMEIIRMTAQGMQPKSIARIENCSVKTVYTHRRNAEAKLYSKIYKLVQ